jgi:arylsulfatase
MPFRGTETTVTRKCCRLLLLVLVTTASAGCDRASAATKPNVVMISIDTLRADHVGSYGYTRGTTPHIDAWARRAIVLERAVATAPVTLDSHMSVFTSLYPDVHGVRWFQQPSDVPRARWRDPSLHYRALAPRWPTLTEVLRASGYATAAFVRDCFWLGRPFGFARGFETYREIRGSAEATNAQVLPWLRRRDKRPFFLFVHYYDVHSDWGKLPYQAPPAFRQAAATHYAGHFTGCDPVTGRPCATPYLMELDRRHTPVPAADLAYLRALYDGGVAYADAQVGVLLAELDALGLRDDTLVVLFADHGEEFREHGGFLHWQLYRETQHVPLVFSYPRRLPRGARVPVVVSLVDVAPTILDLLDMPRPPEMQGRSLAGLLRGTMTRPGYVFGSIEHGHSIQKGNWKLIRLGPTRRELYHLGRDPGERHNLIRRRPTVALRLERRLDAWLRTNRRRRDHVASQGEGEGAVVRPGAEDVQRLRQLGYVE